MECCANVGSYAVAPTAAAVAYVRPGQDVKLPAIFALFDRSVHGWYT